MTPSKLPPSEKPKSLRTREWIFYAQQYAEAASLLDIHTPEQWLPRVQLSGQSVECGLKAYLSAAEQKVPTSHNLLLLGKQAEDSGCLVTDSQALAVFHLSLFFHQDIRTGTKYKARYPSSNSEARDGPIALHDNVVELVESLCSQAAIKAASTAVMSP